MANELMNHRLVAKKNYEMSVFAMLMVLLIHAFDVDSYSTTNLCYYIFAKVEMGVSIAFSGHIAVNVFLFVSGYNFAYNLCTESDFLQKIKRRIRSIIVPYVIWSLLGLVFYVTITSVPIIAAKVNMGVVAFNARNIIDALINQRYMPHLWYLQTLFLYFMVTPILIFLSKKKITGYLLLLLLVVVPLFLSDNSVFHIDRLAPYYAGLLSVKHEESKTVKAIKAKLSNRLIRATFILALVTYSIMITICDNYVLDKLGYYILPILFVCLAYGSKRELSITGRLKNRTFIIYCVHRPIIESIKQLFSLIGRGTETMILSYILSPIITLFISYCIAEIISRKLPKVYAVISGGR